MSMHERIYSRRVLLLAAYIAFGSGWLCGQDATPAKTPSAATETLTVQQAEQLALRNNPQISIGRLLALTQGQMAREVRSAEMPVLAANLTAVEPHNGSRLAAGALNNPIVYERAAGGMTLSQLITDFGRTPNLVASANLQAKAQQASQAATLADITLAVDQAFYRALATQAVVRIAQQTVSLRQETSAQATALANAKLKSDLDKSFADVNLSQAKLLLLNAQNAEQEAMAMLNELLGFERQHDYQLTEDTASVLPPPPQDVDGSINQAFQSRPDLTALVDKSDAADRFRRAEHDLWRPTISVGGAAGDIPVRADQFTSSWYGAIGINMNIPVFNGFQFQARAKEADYRADTAKEQVRALRYQIARDVKTSVLNAQSSFQRITVTEQLLQQANLALDLAQTRYKIGLGTIVELSQAQLQQTEAEISRANARYNYQSDLAVLRFQTGQ